MLTTDIHITFANNQML